MVPFGGSKPGLTRTIQLAPSACCHLLLAIILLARRIVRFSLHSARPEARQSGTENRERELDRQKNSKKERSAGERTGGRREPFWIFSVYFEPIFSGAYFLAPARHFSPLFSAHTYRPSKPVDPRRRPSGTQRHRVHRLVADPSRTLAARRSVIETSLTALSLSRQHRGPGRVACVSTQPTHTVYPRGKT